MKKKEKIEVKIIKILVIIAILIAIVVAIIYFVTRPKQEENNLSNENDKEYIQTLEDGTKYNTSTKLKETKTIEGLEISDIQLTRENGQSIILANVVNTSTQESSLMMVKITLLDKAGNTLAEVNGIIQPLKQGENMQLNMGTTQDCTNAYDFTIEKK